MGRHPTTVTNDNHEWLSIPSLQRKRESVLRLRGGREPPHVACIHHGGFKWFGLHQCFARAFVRASCHRGGRRVSPHVTQVRHRPLHHGGGSRQDGCARDPGGDTAARNEPPLGDGNGGIGVWQTC